VIINRVSEREKYEQFGIFLPLISKPILDIHPSKGDNQELFRKGQLYDCLNVCFLCHSLYFMYECKLKNSKQSLSLFKIQVILSSWNILEQFL